MENLKSLIPDAEINHLDKEYQDEKINVEAEREKLLRADVVVFQFPYIGLNVRIYLQNDLRMF